MFNSEWMTFKIPLSNIHKFDSNVRVMDRGFIARLRVNMTEETFRNTVCPTVFVLSFKAFLHVFNGILSSQQDPLLGFPVCLPDDQDFTNMLTFPINQENAAAFTRVHLAWSAKRPETNDVELWPSQRVEQYLAKSPIWLMAGFHRFEVIERY
jgi:hypothetical protein